MKREAVYLMIVFLQVLTVSCEKEVVLDLSDRQGLYLVVEANIDDVSSNQWIRLSRSSSYYEVSAGKPVSDAKVTITRDESDHVFNESHVDSLAGYYINSTLANKLRYGTYRLTVEHEGRTYSAESEYKPVPDIDSVTIDLNFFSSSGLTSDTLYDINIHFRNLKGEVSYYLVDLYINRKLQTGKPSQKTVFSDQDLEDYVSYSVKTISQDDFDDGDMLGLALRSISREMYEFYQVFFFQTDLSGNPFAGAPPANIPTNLSEGAIGFFQVSSVTSAMKEFRSIGD